MRAGGPVTVVLLLSARARKRIQPEIDADDRRAVHPVSVLRSAQDDGLVADHRPGGQSETGPAADEDDGAGDDLSQASAVGGRARSQGLSLSFERRCDYETGQSLGDRHHVHSPRSCVRVSGCDSGEWFSRYVLSWELSLTLEKAFCLEALRQALRLSRPEIFNTDQGAQFTSPEFTGLLDSERIQVSMDGRGRVYDNIFVERLWRSVKYEEVYLHEYQAVPEARAHLDAYFRFYIGERLHEALGYRTPHEVHFGTSATMMPATESVFDMDGTEIVVPRANGEAVFSGFHEKWLLGNKMNKMVTTVGPGMHLQKAPKLSKEWGEGQEEHRIMWGHLRSIHVNYLN